jgi:hypothetical protein
MHIVAKRLTKWMVRSVSVFLPQEKKHDLERWRRGREDFWKYGRCDYVFASYGKSGRTWVRVMISRYYQLARELGEGLIMGFDNFPRARSAGRGRLPVLPVEVPDAALQEGHEQIPGAWRRDLRLRVRT